MPDLCSEIFFTGTATLPDTARQWGPFGSSLTASSQLLPLWFTHSLLLLESYNWLSVFVGREGVSG